MEQRNGELERLLAGATATAQSKRDMVKDLLARIGQSTHGGKIKEKAAPAS